MISAGDPATTTTTVLAILSGLKENKSMLGSSAARQEDAARLIPLGD